MKTLTLTKSREKVGKSNTRRGAENQGNVPCVLYGGEKQVCFYVMKMNLGNLFTLQMYL